jgi:putative flippase GtrA
MSSTVLKAISFALIGLVNTAVDFVVFTAARWVLMSWPIAIDGMAWAAEACHCGNQRTVTLIVANTLSWSIAVSGSYVMNSRLTFAAESGGKLKLSSYGMFLASGIVGYLANTTTLLVAAVLLPDLVAKVCAILVSFVVNFSMSHFVVFRRRPSVEEAR